MMGLVARAEVEYSYNIQQTPPISLPGTRLFTGDTVKVPAFKIWSLFSGPRGRRVGKVF